MWSVSDKLTEYYLKNNHVDSNKVEIYRYGFKLIISDIINFSIVLTIGLFLGLIFQSFVFLLTLCTVRIFSGGFHAKTFLLCRLSMVITFLAVLILSDLMINNINNIFTYINLINVFSFLIIVLLSPVEHINKPLSVTQKKKNKLKASIVTFIWSAISEILIFADIKEGITISITLLSVVILMLIGIMIRKRGERNV